MGKNILFFIVSLFLVVLLFSSCKTTMLMAPDGSVLIVSVNPSTIPIGGTAVVTVIGYKPSGSLVPDGTVIFFSSDIGNIEPSAETIDGMVKVNFVSDDGNAGTANISINSGTATVKKSMSDNAESSDTITIEIIAPRADSMVLTADPMMLPPDGGHSQLKAVLYDQNMDPMANMPVLFETTAGVLDSGGLQVFTDANGQATDSLYTEEEATVTAISGELKPTVKIQVLINKAPRADFSYSPNIPTIDPETGVATAYFNASLSEDDDRIVTYRWDFGDGTGRDGKIVSHNYTAAATYNVVLVVIDNHGLSHSKAKPVTVQDAPTE